MSNIAVRFVDLGKMYRIAGPRPKYDTLRESLARSFYRVCAAFPGQSRSLDNSGGREIWALKDVSFEISRGEVVGIIGRNGAGKSTLLKVLAGITEPTTGQVEVRGRVASLIEVGTGFHPELTGRENIFLNGSILGMSRAEIRRQFDQIIDFAEVGPFVDTPVKHYSSGMYMRLAFAVAAHLQPEVLLIDEVLAVGDAEFQKKCLGRMSDVSREGRTVLFVSHNMHAVQRLCTRCLLFDKGRVIAIGPTGSVITQYLASGVDNRAAGGWVDLTAANRTGSGACRYTAVQYSSNDPNVAYQPYQEGPLVLTLAVESTGGRRRVSLAASIYDQHGTKLINADSDTVGGELTLPPGSSVWELRIDRLHLKPGVYLLGLYLADRFGDVYDRIEAAVQLEVVELVSPGLGMRVDGRYDGVVTCRFDIRKSALQTPKSSEPTVERGKEISEDICLSPIDDSQHRH